MLLPGRPIAAPGTAVSHRVTGGAGKLSRAGQLGAGVLRVCPREDTPAHSPAPPPQASSPPAASTTGAARTCVCSRTKATSTAPAVAAASSRTTSPARVRGGPWAQTGTVSPQTLQQPQPHQQPGPPKPQFLGGRRGYRRPGPGSGDPSPPSPAVNSSCRAQDEFACANGECINFSLTCDGVSHCKDKSDEKPSYCSKGPRPHPQGPASRVSSLSPHRVGCGGERSKAPAVPASPRKSVGSS